MQGGLLEHPGKLGILALAGGERSITAGLQIWPPQQIGQGKLVGDGLDAGSVNLQRRHDRLEHFRVVSDVNGRRLPGVRGHVVKVWWVQGQGHTTLAHEAAANLSWQVGGAVQHHLPHLPA